LAWTGKGIGEVKALDNILKPVIMKEVLRFERIDKLKKRESIKDTQEGRHLGIIQDLGPIASSHLRFLACLQMIICKFL
jgi:hypothetical protein